MRILLSALLLALGTTALHGQTIIDLKRGGGVRAKTIDDYKREQQMTERLAGDSVTYVDHLRRAFNALRTDSVDQADRLFKAALKLRPDAPGNYVIHYYLAQIESARGHYDKAIEKFSSLLRDMPDYYDARLGRAEAALQAGKAREAIDDCTLLITPGKLRAVPDDLRRRALFVRAAAQYQLRLFTQTRTDLETLLREEPDNTEAQTLDALTLQKMGQPKEALNRLNLIVAAHPQNVEALTTRAGIEAELEMYALARADYDTLIRLHPTESDYYIERARMLLRLDQKQAARNDLDKAVKLGVPMGVVQALYNLTR